MRSTSIIAAAALAVAILTFGSVGTSEAQTSTSVYKYDMTAAWWDAYECPEMMILLPAYADADGAGAGTAAETDANHKKRVCVLYNALSNHDKLVLERFIESTDVGSPGHATHKAWWDSQIKVNKQILAGALRIVADGTAGEADRYGDQTTAAATTGSATLFGGTADDDATEYDDLTSLAKAVVDKAGNALSGRGAMMTDGGDDGMTDAPALPFIATIGLGGILAGRGWWLRRRQ